MLALDAHRLLLVIEIQFKHLTLHGVLLWGIIIELNVLVNLGTMMMVFIKYALNVIILGKISFINFFKKKLVNLAHQGVQIIV